jgi:hypothetical protein
MESKAVNGQGVNEEERTPHRTSLRVLTFAMTFGLAALAGCHKQPKPAPIVPPPSFPQSALSLPPVQPMPPPGVTPVAPPSPESQSKAQVRPPKQRPRHPVEKKNPEPTSSTSTSSGATVAHAAPPRITTPSNLPDPAGVISPTMPHSDEVHHRLTTAQLIQSTEDNLKNLNRTLSDDDKAVVEQIKNYLAQSRTATSENDLVRAHNLALKAHLLSDELVRP